MILFIICSTFITDELIFSNRTFSPLYHVIIAGKEWRDLYFLQEHIGT